MRPPHLWEQGSLERELPAAPDGILAGATKMSRLAGPIPERIPKGSRHREFVSYAGTMRRRGATAEEIAAALTIRNRHADPPLPEDEVLAIAEDVARRYEPAPPDAERQRLEQEAERLFAGWESGGEPPQGEPAAGARRQAAPLIVSLVEFLGGSDGDAAWLVDHLAARGALVVVAGLPKVGKSTFVYGMLGALTRD